MPSEFPRRQENQLVLLFCLVAAVRVFAFAAAFPFFNNVNEQTHFDLVLRYASGQVPRKLDNVTNEASYYIAAYGSPEYFTAPGQFPSGKYPPPLWTQPADQVGPVIQATAVYWQNHVNHEDSQPPLYYAVAGLWLRIGRLCGFEGGLLLYWVRFLNIGIAFALVWLGYVAARLVFPDRLFIRLGVPMLLAVFPQTAFYAIQSDVLSPLFCGAAFIGLVMWMRTDTPSVRLGLFTGLALAASLLVKTSNLPLLAVAGAAVFLHAAVLARTRNLRRGIPALAALLLCAGLPLACWVGWNLHTFGDWSASAAKVQVLGWTTKPFSQWWHHPIYTPTGLWLFWSELIAKFWQGELVWWNVPLDWPWLNMFYALSTTALLGVAAAGLIPRLAPGDRRQRAVLLLAMGMVIASVGYLAFLSTIFDFGACVNPSREHPYFTSGRIIGGALIPFLLLYMWGLDRVLSPFKSPWPRWIAMAGVVLLIGASEIAINRVAFSSPYNWFHLLFGAA